MSRKTLAQTSLQTCISSRHRTEQVSPQASIARIRNATYLPSAQEGSASSLTRFEAPWLVPRRYRLLLPRANRLHCLPEASIGQSAASLMLALISERSCWRKQIVQRLTCSNLIDFPFNEHRMYPDVVHSWEYCQIEGTVPDRARLRHITGATPCLCNRPWTLAGVLFGKQVGHVP
jgi:hypothetical protein